MRMTHAELKTALERLQRVANDPFAYGLDLRPLSEAIARNWVGVAVTKDGKLRVTLTRAGRTTLETAPPI